MPQTRHYEMKDSGVEWIGEIPRGWAVERLKAMFSFGKGLPITKENLVEQGIPVISYGQIHAKFNTGVEVLPQLLRYVDAKWLESNANSLVSEGDFIFADTSEDMEGCGNCVYVDTLNEGAQLFAGYHTIIFKPKRSKHNKFLAYLFKSDAWRTQLRSRVGGVKLFSISRRMLNLATVILPPQNEQTAIAAYLDEKCATIDAIIAEAKASIEEYKSWKASVIFETVTKGLNPNAEMKDSGVEWIGLIPGHWVVKRLKYVAVSLSKGNGITKDETAEDGDTPCVRYGEIYAKYNQSFMECQTRTYKDIITSPKYFTYGDILITCTGELVEEIGKSVAYLGSEKCLAGGDIIVLKHTQNASFLNYALNCNYAQSQKSCDKAKLKVVHISAYDVGNIWMALPPLPEQTAIASYLDSKCAAIDSVIAEKEALISDLETYKRSLIFEVVTGKRRVC